MLLQIAMLMEYAADVSLAYEGRAVREHTMSAPGGSAHGDSGDRSKYGVPCLAAKCDGCATTGIGGGTHGDGDDEPSIGVDRCVAEPIDRNRS
jgi:hypothetical protein